MAQAPGGSAVVRVRAWQLWTGPPRMVAWVLATVGLAAGLVVVGAATTPFPRPRDVATWLVMLGCATVSVEAVRRIGQPAGVSKDLLSVWTLPVAFLLPPVYALLIPIPLVALRQLRLGPSLLYRRVFSAAAIGLADWLVSTVFHRVLHAAGGASALDGHGSREVVAALAVGCAVLGCVANVVLIGVAVQLAAPGTGWRELVFDREQRTLDAGEICLGVAVTACWLVTPAVALAMVLPVVLIQRTLSLSQLQAAARTDAKTGLLNAKAWQGEAEREIVRARREGQPLAVLIADIDRFKEVNDRHGHLAGDVALLAAVGALTGGLRTYDQLGRFGGEEFTALLPRTGTAEARRIAERLRRAVVASPILLGDEEVRISVSIGIAVLGAHGDDLTDLLTAADHALYQAKSAGRNRVALAV